jgi:hypothetical protein
MNAVVDARVHLRRLGALKECRKTDLPLLNWSEDWQSTPVRPPTLGLLDTAFDRTLPDLSVTSHILGGTAMNLSNTAPTPSLCSSDRVVIRYADSFQTL